MKIRGSQINPTAKCYVCIKLEIPARVAGHVVLGRKQYCKRENIQALILVKPPCPHMTLLASNCLN